MDPENDGFEQESPFPVVYFQANHFGLEGRNNMAITTKYGRSTNPHPTYPPQK